MTDTKKPRDLDNWCSGDPFTPEEDRGTIGGTFEELGNFAYTGKFDTFYLHVTSPDGSIDEMVLIDNPVHGDRWKFLHNPDASPSVIAEKVVHNTDFDGKDDNLELAPLPTEGAVSQPYTMWSGTIGGTVVYDGELSRKDRNRLLKHLCRKYGIRPLPWYRRPWTYARRSIFRVLMSRPFTGDVREFAHDRPWVIYIAIGIAAPLVYFLTLRS